MPTGLVLIVDGDSATGEALGPSLERHGFGVKVSSSLAEAAQLVRAEVFSCVLVSRELPDGSGLELVRFSREAQPHTAWIVLSTATDAAPLIEALRAGAMYAVEKPLRSVPLLVEEVVQAVAHHEAMVEREVLSSTVRDMHASQSADHVQAGLAVAEQAAELARDDAKHAVEELNAKYEEERREFEERLERVKQRHSKTVLAMRRAAAELANMLAAHEFPAQLEQELRELRRLMTTVLDAPEP